MPARWGAIGACLVVFAAGCGTQAAETPVAAEEAAVAALDARISGTAQQQVDGMFLDYVKMQDDLVQCFAAFGATYQPSPFGQAERPRRPGQLSAPVPVAMSVDLNEISARLDESIEQRLAGSRFPEITSPDFGSDAFTKAANTCQPVNATQERYATPIHDAWFDLFARAASTPQSSVTTETYVPCMTKAGFEVTDAEDAYGPYPELNALPGSPKDVKAAAMARATADANCRRDAHNQFIRNLAAEIPQFTATHSAQIAEAEAQWQAISREADKTRVTWYKAHPELPRL